jgi:DnaJ-class molecular chaperone
MSRTCLTKDAQIHQLQRALEQERSDHAQTREKCKQYLSTSLQFKQRLDTVEAEITLLNTSPVVCDKCKGSGMYEPQGWKVTQECEKCNGEGLLPFVEKGEGKTPPRGFIT